MRFAQVLVWVCQGIMVLVLVQFEVCTFALDINVNLPEKTVLKENNTSSTTGKTMSQVDTKLYLGHGIYLYKVNETNSTAGKDQWQLKNADIPKLFRLGFPAADQNVPYTTSNDGNKNANSNSNIAGIHPWILGLASFVGCLLIMVVITVAILARRWMIVTFQTRRTRRYSIDNDLDNLVVEADLDGPKSTASNLSPLPPPMVNNNAGLSMIVTPNILTYPHVNREQASLYSQNIYPYSNVDRSIMMPNNHTRNSQFCDNLLPASRRNSHRHLNNLDYIPENDEENDDDYNTSYVSQTNENTTRHNDVDFLPSFTSTDRQLNNIYGLNRDTFVECRTTSHNVEYSPPTVYNNDNNNYGNFDNLSEYSEQLLFQRVLRHGKNLHDSSYYKNRQVIDCDEFHEHSNYSSKQTNDLASRSIPQENIVSTLAIEDLPPQYEICDTDAIFNNKDSRLRRNNHLVACNSYSNNSIGQIFSDDVCAKMVEFIPSEEQFCRHTTASSSPYLSPIAEIPCFVDDSSLGGISKNMNSDVNVSLNDSASSYSNPSSLLS